MIPVTLHEKTPLARLRTQLFSDDDWKNLPNPDTAFLAAGSRHRVKRHVQRAAGVDHIDCTDEESNLLHLAHEAFNVLAQLELVITNRIK